MFNEDGTYNKTNWKAGDKITAGKLNKIEESLEAINNNDISRHVEADTRLDALEEQAAGQNEVTNERIEELNDLVLDNKDELDLEIYDINSRMTFLENELNEGIEEVYNVAETVDGKIATAEANMTTQVDQGKADMEAMVAEVEDNIDDINSRINQIAILDDSTSTIQELINTASTSTHYIKLQPILYEVGRLTPKSHVTIDLNGATLKLSDNVNLPLFYDTVGGVTNFNVINGNIDLNNTNNNSVNQSAGFMWLSNANTMTFSNLTITNAFRNIFNFYTCDNVVIKNVECNDCGLANDNSFYTYGASFESNCNNIEIDNFRMNRIYGYGIHIRQSNQAKLSNIYFNDFVRNGYSIGITLTDANNVQVTNFNHIDGDYIGIECNHSKNVIFNNINIDSTVTPFVFGDNGSGEFNESIKINNLTTTNTTGTISMNLNYINNMLL